MTEADTPSPAEAVVQERVPLSRREFLNYVWAMSIAVFLAAGGGAAVWFLYPRFREGEFGGIFTIPVGEIPPQGSPPKEISEGRFWLSNLGPQNVNDPRQPEQYPLQPGVKAIYKVCTHLGCLYKWVETSDRSRSVRMPLSWFQIPAICGSYRWPCPPQSGCIPDRSD